MLWPKSARGFRTTMRQLLLMPCSRPVGLGLPLGGLLQFVYLPILVLTGLHLPLRRFRLFCN